MSLLGAAPASAQKVLVFSKTAGFRHDSIPQGIAADPGDRAGERLRRRRDRGRRRVHRRQPAQYEAVVWLSTTGDVLDDAQQAAFEGYIRAGGGYVGVHAAADTEYAWPWYGELVGAYFNSHPVQPERDGRRDRPRAPLHEPSAGGLDAPDEWYNYRSNPRRKVHVLAELDESSYYPAAARWATTTRSPGAGTTTAAAPGTRAWATRRSPTPTARSAATWPAASCGRPGWRAVTARSTSPSRARRPRTSSTGSALGCQWSIVRPNASKYAVGGGALKITTENGDLYGGGGSAKNLILQDAPSGAWEATTKVTIDARDGSQQAGMLLYANDDNYVKVVLLARQNQRWFEIVQEINGQPRYDAALDRLNVGADYPTTFYVRLTQAEGTVVAAASPDGTNWTPIGRTADASSFVEPAGGDDRGHQRRHPRHRRELRLLPDPALRRAGHDAAVGLGGRRRRSRPRAGPSSTTRR